MDATASHEMHVAWRVHQIGTHLGLAPEHVGELQVAALLHDIGKVGLSRRLLHKTASLTDAEYALIKSHAILGATLIEWTGQQEVALWVRHHHERWDGGGYPDGLAAQSIPLPSRIIAVADVFDALTSDRPYRRAGSTAAAIVELQDCAGTQFDPTCVEALVAVLLAP